MAEKHITLGQLKRQALRGKAETAGRIAELAELVAGGLSDMKPVGITVTLPAINWKDGVQKVSHESFLADKHYWYVVCGDADCFMEYWDSGVRADNITDDGQATFRCEAKPDSDLTVNILRLEVGYE